MGICSSITGMEFLNHPIALMTVGILSIPVYVMLAKVFFGERFETLVETIKYIIWPDWYFFLKGKFWEDWDASMKFNIYLFLCFGWVAAITELLARHVL